MIPSNSIYAFAKAFVENIEQETNQMPVEQKRGKDDDDIGEGASSGTSKSSSTTGDEGPKTTQADDHGESVVDSKKVDKGK